MIQSGRTFPEFKFADNVLRWFVFLWIRSLSLARRWLPQENGSAAGCPHRNWQLHGLSQSCGSTGTREQRLAVRAALTVLPTSTPQHRLLHTPSPERRKAAQTPE